jgi:hypothetical protein
MDELELYLEIVLDSLNKQWIDEDKETGFVKGYLQAIEQVLNKVKRIKDEKK